MIKEELEKKLSDGLGEKIILNSVRSGFGDFCIVPGEVKRIGGLLKQSPDELLKNIETILQESLLTEEVALEAGYINIHLSKTAFLNELEAMNDLDEHLKNSENNSQTIVFDYSSPNIAKPFSVGHLRSTIIGQANYNIFKTLGYNVIGVNHIGDWGTQFGKLIVAIKKWGNREAIEQNPIEQLNALYVKFHVEAESDQSLNDQAREWFKKLEDKEEEARDIWQMCVEASFKEFERIYKILGIEIDEVKGESFYEDKLMAVVDELKEKGLLVESEGAQIVELENMPPALIRKNDGATLYMTRDLAALKYRLEQYAPSKIIYHVGNDQSLHFRQLEAVAKKLGWLDQVENIAQLKRNREGVEIVFAGHGMIRLPEGKMSTRSGRTVLFEDLLEEATQMSQVLIEEKGSEVEDKSSLAKAIAISAIKYADLSQNRTGDVVFSFDKMISLKGNCALYLQYSLTRIKSIEQKLEEQFGSIESIPYLSDESIALAKIIINFKQTLENAATNSKPNLVAEFTYSLTNEFNSFYEKQRIISEDVVETAKNVFVIRMTGKIISKCFEILGISVIDEI